MNEPELTPFKATIPGAYACATKYGIGAGGATQEEAAENLTHKIIEHIRQLRQPKRGPAIKPEFPEWLAGCTVTLENGGSDERLS